MSTTQQQQDPFDDWETADYSSAPALNSKQTWEQANNTPSYTIESSHPSAAVQSLASAPKHQILKRENSDTKQPANAPAAVQKSHAERNKDYQAARARIFGEEEAKTEEVHVVRQPKQPQPQSIGFQRKPPST